MHYVSLALILISVLMICTGQILFKLVAMRLNSGLAWTDLQVIGVMIAAISIYGTATLLWIYVLRTIPLTKAYPYMALSFVIVPFASGMFFSEQVRPIYILGTALIVAGVILTSYPSQS